MQTSEERGWTAARDREAVAVGMATGGWGTHRRWEEEREVRRRAAAAKANASPVKMNYVSHIPDGYHRKIIEENRVARNCTREVQELPRRQQMRSFHLCERWSGLRSKLLDPRLRLPQDLWESLRR